jgi:hypothetical protein
MFNFSLLHLLRLEWTLVSGNTECSGAETEKTLQPDAEIQDCANECDGVSSMFLFSPGQNRCFCETAATAEGSCTVIDIVGWDLYKYGNEGRFLIIFRKLAILRTMKFINITFGILKGIRNAVIGVSIAF